MKTCHVCGNILKETDKFCSQCGEKVQSEDKSIESTSIEISEVELKICDVCGEENPIDLDECEYCGAGFSGKEKIVKKNVSSHHEKKVDSKSQPIEQKKTSSETKKIRHKLVEKQTSTTPKTLDKNRLILMILAFLVVAVIIIYYGISESQPKSSGNLNQSIENQSRIDLSLLNEINQLENEIKNDPKNASKLLRLANLNHDAGFFEKAINYYKDYLILKPDDNDAEVDMGVCYFELNKLDEAEKIFESVIKKNPKHQIAFLNLGIVNLNQQEIDKAKDYFKKCIALGEHTDAGHRAKELLESH